MVANNVAALFSNTAWLVLPPTLASALEIPQNCSDSGINSGSVCGQAARPGDLVQIYATGLGGLRRMVTRTGRPLPPGRSHQPTATRSIRRSRCRSSRWGSSGPGPFLRSCARFCRTVSDQSSSSRKRALRQSDPAQDFSRERLERFSNDCYSALTGARPPSASVITPAHSGSHES